MGTEGAIFFSTSRGEFAAFSFLWLQVLLLPLLPLCQADGHGAALLAPTVLIILQLMYITKKTL